MDNNIKNPQPSLMEHSMRAGAELGLITIAIHFLLYMIEYTQILKWWMSTSLFLLATIYPIFMGIKYRNLRGGLLSFRNGYVYSILAFFVYSILFMLFNLSLYHVIDNTLAKTMTLAQIDQIIAVMEKMNIYTDDLLENLETEIKKGYTILGFIKGFGFNMFFYAILSTITALIIKKDEPING